MLTARTVKLELMNISQIPEGVVEGTPYAPDLYYNCNDPGCCPFGDPRVNCRVCGKEWPCPDYKASHTQAQANSQARWVVRATHRDEYPDLIEYRYRALGIEAVRG